MTAQKQISIHCANWRNSLITNFSLSASNTLIKSRLNTIITRHMCTAEMTGLLMRITSFSMAVWIQASSLFRLVQFVSALDAILLSWCAVLRRDSAYTAPNTI